MRKYCTFSLLVSLFAFPFTLLCQDTIIFENKHPFLVDVQEENERDVIYKKIDIISSPTYILSKRYVTDIRYQDPEAGKLKFKSKDFSMQRDLEVWVTPMDSSEVVRGWLHRLNDTTLVLQEEDTRIPEARRKAIPEVVQIFPYQNIRHVKVRRRKQIGKHAAFGAAGGFVIGTLTGLLIFDDEPACDPSGIDGRMCDESLLSPQTKWEKSLLLGFGTGGVGLVGGGVYGSVKVKFPIGGRRDTFNAAIPKLERLGGLQ